MAQAKALFLTLNWISILTNLRQLRHRHIKMQWQLSITTALFAVVHAQNMLRFSCSQLNVQRLDPIVAQERFHLSIFTKLPEEILLMPLWTPVTMTLLLFLLAQHALSARTSLTTGPPLCISKHAMEPSSASHRWQTSICSKMVA